MSVAAKRTARLRRAAVVAVVCAVFVGATALAVARTVAGPAALRPVPGSGEFRFSGKGSVGVAEGTVTTKVIPAAIKPGEPVRFIVDLRWTDTDQGYACPYGSGSGAVPGQTGKIPQVTILFIRPGHGEDLLANKGFAPPADTTRTMNGFTYACGPPNRITRTEGYDARVPGSTTASMKPGCYAPYPGNDAIPIAYLGPDATFEGTFATLSVGGVDCAAAATGVPAATAFTDTFSAAGQAKPHAVAVTARDAAGNWSTYSYSVTVTPSITDDAAFTANTTWGRYNLTDTVGGTYLASSVAGSSFTYTAAGRDLALIGPKFSTAGRATLYCDGVSYGLIDAYNATTAGRQVIAWCHFTQTGQHTMKLIVEGTSGRPWFGVDAFAALA